MFVLLLALITYTTATCDKFKMDCMMTEHNGSTWVVSALESCQVEPMKIRDMFPCYRFNNPSFDGDFISPKCNLRTTCKRIENNPPMYPFILFSGLSLMIFIF